MIISLTAQEWTEYRRNPNFAIETLEKLLLGPIEETGLTADNMQNYTTDQLTIIAYLYFRREMLEGGLIQLIYNGYGPFIFLNPFAKALRQIGMKDFSKYIYKLREIYETQRQNIEGLDISDSDFMALYEQHPEMEDPDDEFIEMEPVVSFEIMKFAEKIFVNN